ncbi:MAG TPA: 23S rRNA (uracil(1939)-C(5))-methyltransferase RlmD [Chloroflexota bacterium]
MTIPDERTADEPGTRELELLAAVQGGQTLARLDGQVVFVQGGIAGEIVQVEGLSRKRGYLDGAAHSLVRASASRAMPPCPYFGENGRHRGALQAPGSAGLVCGGCQYQHIDYQGQLDLKRTVLRDTLRRVGKIVDPPVGEPEGSPSPFHYRNKATWLVTDEGELAYHEARSHRAVPITECHLLTPPLRAIFDALSSASGEIGLAGMVRSLEARSLPDLDGIDAGTLVLDLAPGTTSHEAEALAEALAECCPAIRTVARRALAAPLGSPDPPAGILYGSPRTEVMVLGERLSLSPTSFFQVNLPVAEALARHVLEQCGLVAGKQALDVYSGVGLFTIPLARQADAVISLELDGGAVADARLSVEAAGLDNATLLQGDAAANLKAILPGTMQCAIVDPPRTGCSPHALRQLARIKAPRLVYVSCDAATLARDLRVLLDFGYELESVRPFDIFPQTAHIESVSSLRLPKKRKVRS